MMHWAAHYDAVAAIEEFISREEVDVNVRGRDNLTPLAIASRDGRTGIVRALLRCPWVDVNIS